MTPLDVLTLLFTDYTLRNVALGSALLGITGGVIGGFAVLRRQSLLGDTLAHATLPGICLAFLLTGSKEQVVLLAGGGLTALAAALSVLALLRNTRLPEDAALGVMLSVFFGVGIAALTFIQNGTNAGQAGLDKFLFGQAATIVAADVILMAAIATLALGTAFLLYKEFKLVTFDPDYGATLGLPVRLLSTVLTSLAVLAVMVGLQSVGVVLMAAMLVAPAVAARQWTDRLGTMLILAAFIGAASGVTGAVSSSLAQGLPTGPLTIVAVSIVAFVSLLFAPARGMVWTALHHRTNAARLRHERLLLDAHVLHNHSELSVATLAHQRRVSETTALSELRGLASSGLAAERDGAWILTAEGDARAHELERALRQAPGGSKPPVATNPGVTL